MKIKSKKYSKGDLKTVKRFALFPVRIGDNKIWLERYFSEYKYVDQLRFTHTTAYIQKWEWLRDFQ
jgi:hypothetical protein